MASERIRRPRARRSGVSIRDVAERAGVSVGTVSNVLNRPGLVGPATQERVRRAIDELGFRRNESARHLRAGASRTIAYVLLDAGNPLFTDVAQGIEEVAEQAGLALYLCNSHEDRQREAHYLDLLAEQRVQGVLITPLDVDGRRLTELPELGIPLVLVDRRRSIHGHCSVSVDDVLGGELAVGHLVEMGHRRIAFVGGPFSIGQVRERFEGSQRAAGQAELVKVETAALNVNEGRRAGQRILGMPSQARPTAAFCANDLLAFGLLQELTQRAVAIPNEFAIVGYDDIDFAAAAAIPLTSVRQPRHELGRAAAELLLEEASDDGSHTHRDVRFDPELIVRASTTPRAGSSA
jgi:LacI family transcriptional regulator, galactose operon repressor